MQFMPWRRRTAEDRGWGMRYWSIPILIVLLAGAMYVSGQEPTSNPHGKLKWECGDCHTTESWSKIAPTKFDHSQTGFSLQGAHEAVACTGCHKDMVFSKIGTACADCHTDIHQRQIGNACDN